MCGHIAFCLPTSFYITWANKTNERKHTGIRSIQGFNEVLQMIESADKMLHRLLRYLNLGKESELSFC